MIVCKRCGNHNPPGDDFCGSCGAFLEWEGEQIVTEEPLAAAPAAPLPPPTLIERIKHAVSGGPDHEAVGDGVTLAPPSGPGAARTPGAALPAPDSIERSMAARLPGEVEQPAARAPEAAVARPKPKVTQPATRQVQPGDLVCGSCGEPNTPPRKFCRRCGTSLAEVVAVKRKWWQRRKSSAAGASNAAGVPAGTRPGASAGQRGRGVGKGARAAKGATLGGLGRARRIVALLAILGIGAGMAIPSWRSAITDKASDTLNWVKRKINPQFAQVSPDPALTAASSSVAGHEAAMVADGASNTFWLADPGDPAATATVTFTPATKLSNLLITPGDQEKKENFKAQPRPKDLFVEAFDRDGKSVKTAQLALEDKIDPQKFGFSAKDVATVRITVQSCFPDPSLRVCPITEIEFFKQK